MKWTIQEEVSKLPEIEQNTPARWEKAFAGSGDLPDRLADETLAGHRDGKTETMNH